MGAEVLNTQWGDRVRPGVSAEVLAPSSPEPDAYKPWGQDHSSAAMLDIRMRSATGIEEQGELVPLHYLLRVSYTGSKIAGDIVTLAFADCLITIRGWHLRELRTGLKAGRVDYIEEFDAERWPQPIDGMPLIERIEVIAPGAGRGSRA